MWMRTLALHLVLLATARLCLSQITISAVQAVITLPEDELQIFAILNCRVEPNDTVESQWRLPSGELLAEGNHPPHRVQDGPASLGGMMMELRVTIIINRISYQDAGNYTCEARPDGDTGEFVSATVELRTRVQIEAQNTSVDVFDNATQVELSCEMTLFIRPDEDLQWFMGGQEITSGTGKYTITYRDGLAPTAAVNGGEMRVPGRVSVLTIFNPEESDSGTYTCSIAGTSESDTVELSVVAAGGRPTTPTSTPPSPLVGTTTQRLPLASVQGTFTQTLGDVEPTATITTGGLPTPEVAESESDRPPIALIVACAAVGISILIMLMMLVIVIVFFVRSRMRRKTVIFRGGRNPTNQYSGQRRKPLYTEVLKPPPPPVPERTRDSFIMTSPLMITEPRELLAYDVDIPETFRPFPPPPLVTGYSNPAATGANKAFNIYDVPETLHGDSIDGPTHDMQEKTPLKQELSSATIESYYDQVETVHDDVSSSLLSSSTLATPKEKEEHDYDHVYSEQLEPSMLQRRLTSPLHKHAQALPYAPVYDTPKPLKHSESPLHISPHSIIEIRDLGVGHFGKVALAATVGLSLKDLNLGNNDDSNKSLLVAIKKLRKDADTDLTDAFEMEIKFMIRLKHANVVRLLGVCRSDDESFLMMEYMENGDLHEFLRKQTLVSDTVEILQDTEVTPLVLLYMAVQIASGMRYLATNKFVHRDLATRNCLVGRDFVVKISDFGMSRNLYKSSYYQVQGRLILPIRWMAYEAFYGKFSVKSDVWSYGIVVWEIFTLAQNEPYPEMTDEEMIADAILGKKRKLLPKPDACPEEVYEIVRRCWVHEVIMRADFEEVYSRLFLAYTNLSKQISQIE